ncbi:MAG: hypothetical protein AAFQ42_12615 [Pseudomonadota bacterium]
MPDAIVGLRFEVSGGLGRMSGRVLGRVQDLYLVQRDGLEHSELLELGDLRPARFFAPDPATRRGVTGRATPIAAAPPSPEQAAATAPSVPRAEPQPTTAPPQTPPSQPSPATAPRGGTRLVDRIGKPE